MSRDMVEQLLAELSEWLDFQECDPVEWVICGGVALILQDLRPRTTRDVDVLGEWNPAGLEIALIDDFPEPVKHCIRRVVQNHPHLEGFGTRWINLGASHLARCGLPEGYETRIVTRHFGDKLTLHLLHRDDLVPLKLYAASDDHSGRQEVHLEDLKALEPTFEELDRAVAWVRTLPDFEQKRAELNQVVRNLGYDDLAYYI